MELSSAITSIVLDEAVIVQILKPGTAKNFDEYAQDIFIPYMSSKLQTASSLDLVWNSYNPDSLKSSARAKHGKGVQRRVVPAAAISGNWHNFLQEDSNKTKLFGFLSEALLKWFTNKDKQLVIILMVKQCSVNQRYLIYPHSLHAIMKKLTAA